METLDKFGKAFENWLLAWMVSFCAIILISTSEEPVTQSGAISKLITTAIGSLIYYIFKWLVKKT